jgi:hypothetical protein
VRGAIDNAGDDDQRVGFAVVVLGCLILFWVLKWLISSSDNSK